MHQWAAMWSNVAEEAEEEMDTPSAQAAAIDVSGDPETVQKTTEYQRVAVGALLGSIADEMKKAEGDIRTLMEIVKNVDNDELSSKLDEKLVVLGGISKVNPTIPGEWINIAMGKIKGQTEKSTMRSLNSVLKIILMKLVPYDMAIPLPTREFGDNITPNVRSVGDVQSTSHAENVRAEIPQMEFKPSSRRGKLDVGEYHIGSKLNAENKRYWPCPYENCEAYFFSSRKCGAHLNEHIGRIYVCERCKYETYNLDSYDHHRCFSGRKTQSAETKEGKKYGKRSMKSGKQSEDLGEGREATTSEQPSTSVKRRGDELGLISDIPVKKEKKEKERKVDEDRRAERKENAEKERRAERKAKKAEKERRAERKARKAEKERRAERKARKAEKERVAERKAERDRKAEERKAEKEREAERKAERERKEMGKKTEEDDDIIVLSD